MWSPETHSTAGNNKSQLWELAGACLVCCPLPKLVPSPLSAHPELHRKHSCGKIILSPGQLRKTTIIKNNDALSFEQWSLFPVRLPKTRPINLLQVGVYFNIVLKVNQAVWLRFPPSDLVLLPSCLH